MIRQSHDRQGVRRVDRQEIELIGYRPLGEEDIQRVAQGQFFVAGFDR